MCMRADFITSCTFSAFVCSDFGLLFSGLLDFDRLERELPLELRDELPELEERDLDRELPDELPELDLKLNFLK